MPESVSVPTLQPQVKQISKYEKWKKPVLVVLAVSAIILMLGGYWYFVLNKSSENSSFTDSEIKISTRTATESAEQSTESAQIEEDKPKPTKSKASFYPMELKVWMIQYTPPNGIPSVYPNAPIVDAVKYSKNILVPMMNEASRYHGYKDPSSKPSLKYVLSDDNIVTEKNPPPWINLLDGKKRYDYAALFSKYNLCQYAKDNDIKAVFLWAGGTVGSGYEGWMWESAITGNKGIPTNGGHLSYCRDKTIVVYGFNYERADTVMEGPGHHLERVWGHFRPEYSTFTDTSYGVNNYHPPQRGDSCGNIHNPPNARHEYDDNNSANFQSDCRNWKPDGSGKKETLNCNSWGCKRLK